MIRLFATLLLLCIAPAAAVAQPSPQRVAWNRAFDPFKIYGNVYYVGTERLSSFLITGPKGHVLIDGGLPESAPQIAAHIQKLGFKLRDVHYLLVSHAHYDHSGGLAELKRLTGAQLVGTAGDTPDLEAGKTIGRTDIDAFPPVKVDRIIADGEQLHLGPVIMTAHLTPGHTPGNISWSTVSNGKTVLFAGSMTVAGLKLVDNPTYPAAAADFRSTFAKLKAFKADVFLSFHPEFFAMKERLAAQVAGKADAFVDPAELGRQVEFGEQAFNAEFAKQLKAAKPQ